MRISRESLSLALQEYMNAEEKALESLPNSPEGRIRISNNQNKTQFFLINKEGNKKGSYISKQKDEFIKALVQKRYAEKVLRLSHRRVRQLKALLRDYKEDELDDLYDNLHEVRQSLVEPVRPTWKQKLKAWMAIEYQGLPLKEDAPFFVTNNGEKVRSKSEKILADLFLLEGIPYKYEKPLRINARIVIHPDFTFLSPETGREIYWEHLGLLDNPDYARSTIRKMHSFAQLGIFPGQNLILTMEDQENPLDIQAARMYIERFLR